MLMNLEKMCIIYITVCEVFFYGIEHLMLNNVIIYHVYVYMRGEYESMISVLKTKFFLSVKKAHLICVLLK